MIITINNSDDGYTSINILNENGSWCLDCTTTVFISQGYLPFGSSVTSHPSLLYDLYHRVVILSVHLLLYYQSEVFLSGYSSLFYLKRSYCSPKLRIFLMNKCLKTLVIVILLSSFSKFQRSY